MKNQVCSKCGEGTYSLGSGIKFDEWDELPAGFSNIATFMDTVVGPSDSRPDGCNNSSWVPRGNYIESNRDDCTVSLIYAVHLKKSGYVFFEYQYVDNNIFFEFFIQNDQCQEMDTTADKWVKLTDNGEWGSHSVMLKSGTNILYWRTTGILMGSKAVKPVLVKNITIEGVAYTSECFPCKPGTFSNKPGSFTCQVCPRNTYSEKGAKECIKCEEHSQFSEEGSSECMERPPCTTKDYFQIHTPCDEEGKPSYKCPAGTCDGCTFYFLWESAEACPLCTEHDFHEIEGACKRGFQETLYVWNEPKWCIKGISLPEKKLSTCETVDFWLKVGAGVGAFTAVLLVALTCYFWKKNQKLEYKYSKLVMTTNSKECELPAADSCALMEGEDNEEEVVYSNKQSLLGKLKSLATKEKENHFESVQLKSSRSPNI
nr:endosome/lysosome-associated apoptosis and autophagy regulator family member 2 [Mirounga angustirostris]